MSETLMRNFMQKAKEEEEDRIDAEYKKFEKEKEREKMNKEHEKYVKEKKEQEEFYSLPTPLRQAFCHAMVIESMLVKAIIEGTTSMEAAQMVLEIMEQTISVRDIVLAEEVKNYEEKNRN